MYDTQSLEQVALEESVRVGVDRKMHEAGLDQLSFSFEKARAEWAKVLDFHDPDTLAHSIGIYDVEQVIEKYGLPTTVEDVSVQKLRNAFSESGGYEQPYAVPQQFDSSVADLEPIYFRPEAGERGVIENIRGRYGARGKNAEVPFGERGQIMPLFIASEEAGALNQELREIALNTLSRPKMFGGPDGVVAELKQHVAAIRTDLETKARFELGQKKERHEELAAQEIMRREKIKSKYNQR